MAAKLPVAASRVRLPDVSRFDFSTPEGIRAYAEALHTAVTRALEQRAVMTQPTAETLMMTKLGDTYAIKLNDDGTVATELRLKVSP